MTVWKGISNCYALLFFSARPAIGRLQLRRRLTPRKRRVPDVLVPLAVLCCFVFADCSSPRSFEADEGTGPSIRVCISERRPTQILTVRRQTVLETAGTKAILSDSVSIFLSVEPGPRLLMRIGAGRTVPIDGPCRFYSSLRGETFTFGGHAYSDTLLVLRDGAGITLINSLPLETYVRNVVPNEIGSRRPAKDLEAVKAQAVLARTYGLAKIRVPLARAYDVYADARDQVFTGMDPADPVASEAVARTEGEVLEYEGRLAECYYHAACGGATEAVSLVWRRPQSKPYLAGMRDGASGSEYCRIAPSWRWSEDYTRAELERMLMESVGLSVDSLGAAFDTARSFSLLDIQIVRRMPSGRVAQLKLLLGEPARPLTVMLEADRIRWAIRQKTNGQILRSTLFDLRIERDGQRWIRRVTVNGGGSGHGIGMCQWGAIGRARKGHTMRQILRAYFPGTELARRY
jgi:stage II sporulation protein D